MAAAFEAVNADRVTTDLLGLERVTDRRAFMDHFYTCRLQRRHILFRTATGGFDDLDAALCDSRDIFRIGRRRERRKKGQVDAERLVGHVVTTRYFLGQQFGGSLR